VKQNPFLTLQYDAGNLYCISDPYGPACVSFFLLGGSPQAKSKSLELELELFYACRSLDKSAMSDLTTVLPL
jgi:hypothetical protein